MFRLFFFCNFEIVCSPYDNRWSKTMIGYGPESNHFVVELTYNYGVTSYDLGKFCIFNLSFIVIALSWHILLNVHKIGNDFNGIRIEMNGILERIKKQNYPYTVENNVYVLQSPDGYKFSVSDVTETNGDPVKGVAINTNDLKKTKAYWIDVLKMKLIKEITDDEITLSYGAQQASLIFKKTSEKTPNKWKIYPNFIYH